MQSKRYSRNNEETVAAGGIFSVLITNTENRRANFHGIRWQGRIRVDNVSADNESHGLLALMCQPGGFVGLTESSFDSDSNLSDLSDITIAMVPFSVFGGSTNPVGTGTIFDWNIVIKTSRTCARGGSIRGKVINYNESAKSIVIANQLLSCFETTV